MRILKKFSTIIIGGGAAGMTAAISAGRKGKDVLICEKTQKLGRKILVSGAGRCNILNDDLSEAYYNPSARKLVKAVFSRFGKEEIKKFFRELGLVMYSDGKRVFPVTNQSASVLRVLEMEVNRLGIPMEFNFDACEIKSSPHGLTVKSKDNKEFSCGSAIITGGGMSYPATGSDGNSYALAGQFGHAIIEPVPSAVPLVVKDKFCHFLQGQKIFAKAKSVINSKATGDAEGELLFTKYGLSGTVILDISRDISIALNRIKEKNAEVVIDMAPFMDRAALKNEFEKRISKGAAIGDLIAGILPNKFSLVFKEAPGRIDLDNMVEELKNKRFKVIGTRGWNEAEFTSGGVSVEEVDSATLESKLKKGVYFAGEVLDVDGQRGGYNLAWAWASGLMAGMA